MKSPVYIIAGVLILSLASLCGAQYGGDPNRGYVDQMVLDHVNNRRLEDRLKSRSHWKNQNSRKQRKGRSKAPAKRLTPVRTGAAQRVSPGLQTVATGSLSLSQDMYSSFGNDEPRGYSLEVKLTPQGKPGQTITQRIQLNSNKGNRSAALAHVPPGRYLLTARSLDANGRARPVLIGTQCGSPTDPQGGNFKSSLPVTMDQVKNEWGHTEVHCRESISFRP